jgi:hypothetical protein
MIESRGPLLRALLLTLIAFSQAGNVSCSGSSAGLSRADCTAWLDLFDSTGGKNWTHCSSQRTDPCSCEELGHAVKCTGDRITSIRLNNNSLAGPLNASIAGLAALETLSLQDNKLTGTPIEALALFFFQYYSSSVIILINAGSVPSEISKCIGLRQLFLNNNNLKGRVARSCVCNPSQQILCH